MAAYVCSSHREEAPARLAGELSPLGGERFDGHQRACPSCRAFFESYTRSLASARAEPAPPTLEERDRAYAALLTRLESAGEAEAAPPPPWQAPGRRWRWPAAGMALAAGVALALGLSTDRTDGGHGAAAAPEAAPAATAVLQTPAAAEAGAAAPIATVPAPSAPRARPVVRDPRPTRRAELAVAAPAVPARAVTPGPSYADVERALADGTPAAAAEMLEALIAARPDGIEADTARLELATLYAGPLHRRVDARRHLRGFLARSPNAAGAGAARALLCRIALDDLTCRR